MDALSAASSTPGVPGPSTATVPARGEPRLVGGSSAAGAGPESVPVKIAARLVLARPFCPGSFHRLRSPPRALSGPSRCVFSGLRERRRAVPPPPDPASCSPLSSPESASPSWLHSGAQPCRSPGVPVTVTSSERPLSPALGAFTRPRPVTPRGLESHPTRPCLQGVCTFPGPPWKACSCCAGAAAFNSCDCRGAAGG